MPQTPLADRESPPHARRVFLPVAASFARKLNLPDDASSVDSLDDRRYSDVPSVRSISLARAKRESNALQRSRELSALQPSPSPPPESTQQPSTREISNFQERANSNLQPRREHSNLNPPTSSIGPSTGSSIGTQSISLAAIPFNYRRTLPTPPQHRASPPPTPTHQRKAPVISDAANPNESKARRSWRRLLPKFLSSVDHSNNVNDLEDVKVSTMQRRPTELSFRRRQDSTATTISAPRRGRRQTSNNRVAPNDDTQSTRSPRRTETRNEPVAVPRAQSGWGACLPSRGRRHSRLNGDRPRDETASYSRLPKTQQRQCAACGGSSASVVADAMARPEPHSFGGFRQWHPSTNSMTEQPDGSSVSSSEWDSTLRAPSNMEGRKVRGLRFR